MRHLDLILCATLLALGLTTCERLPETPDTTNTIDTLVFGSLSGLVLDQETELPIFGAVVLAMQNQVADTTGIRGYFQLDSLNQGEDTLKVTAPGYQIQYEAVVVAADTQQVTFALPKEAQSGHYLYVGNEEGTKVFIIDTENNVVIDTIQGFPYRIWKLTLTKSCRKLYVSTRGGSHLSPGKLFVVDLAALTVTPLLDKVSEVYTAPNGTVFVISKDPDGSDEYLGTIDILSGAITFFDTLDINIRGYFHQRVVFENQRPIFYSFNNAHNLFAYNYLENKVVRTYANLGGDANMVISRDGQRIYLAGGMIIDLESGSHLDRIEGGNPEGTLAFSPNEEYLYITNYTPPLQYMHMEPVESGRIDIIQTSTISHVGYIDVSDAAPSGFGVHINRIKVMPDGKTAYVSHWASYLFVLDLELKAVTQIIDL